MTGLIVVAVLAALGALGWFGFRFVQENVLGIDIDADPRDDEQFQRNLEGCIELAREIKGTGASYARFAALFPKCATTFVSLRVWNDIK